MSSPLPAAASTATTTVASPSISSSSTLPYFSADVAFVLSRSQTCFFLFRTNLSIIASERKENEDNKFIYDLPIADSNSTSSSSFSSPLFPTLEWCNQAASFLLGQTSPTEAISLSSSQLEEIFAKRSENIALSNLIAQFINISSNQTNQQQPLPTPFLLNFSFPTRHHHSGGEFYVDVEEHRPFECNPSLLRSLDNKLLVLVEASYYVPWPQSTDNQTRLKNHSLSSSSMSSYSSHPYLSSDLHNRVILSASSSPTESSAFVSPTSFISSSPSPSPTSSNFFSIDSNSNFNNPSNNSIVNNRAIGSTTVIPAAETTVMSFEYMSHELRNIIQSITSSVDLLDRWYLTLDQREIVEGLQHSSARLLTTVNNALTLSKLQSNEMQLEHDRSFLLSRCVETVLDEAAQQAYNNRVELTYCIDEAVPTVIRGDSAAVSTILQNLIGNAIKFSWKETKKEKSQQRRDKERNILNVTGRSAGERNKNDLISDDYDEDDDDEEDDETITSVTSSIASTAPSTNSTALGGTSSDPSAFQIHRELSDPGSIASSPSPILSVRSHLRNRTSVKIVALHCDVRAIYPSSVSTNDTNTNSSILSSRTSSSLSSGEGGRSILVRICISDEGIGIAKSAFGRIFQRFSQAERSTTRKFGGSGLGTLICKEYVRALGGEISFDSIYGTGTTFFFTAKFQIPAEEINITKIQQAIDKQQVQQRIIKHIHEERDISQFIPVVTLQTKQSIEVSGDGDDSKESKENYSEITSEPRRSITSPGESADRNVSLDDNSLDSNLQTQGPLRRAHSKSDPTDNSTRTLTDPILNLSPHNQTLSTKLASAAPSISAINSTDAAKMQIIPTPTLPPNNDSSTMSISGLSSDNSAPSLSHSASTPSLYSSGNGTVTGTGHSPKEIDFIVKRRTDIETYLQGRNTIIFEKFIDNGKLVSSLFSRCKMNVVRGWKKKARPPPSIVKKVQPPICGLDNDEERTESSSSTQSGISSRDSSTISRSSTSECLIEEIIGEMPIDLNSSATAAGMIMGTGSGASSSSPYSWDRFDVAVVEEDLEELVRWLPPVLAATFSFHFHLGPPNLPPRSVSSMPQRSSRYLHNHTHSLDFQKSSISSNTPLLGNSVASAIPVDANPYQVSINAPSLQRASSSPTASSRGVGESTSEGEESQQQDIQTGDLISTSTTSPPFSPVGVNTSVIGPAAYPSTLSPARYYSQRLTNAMPSLPETSVASSSSVTAEPISSSYAQPSALNISSRISPRLLLFLSSNRDLCLQIDSLLTGSPASSHTSASTTTSRTSTPTLSSHSQSIAALTSTQSRSIYSSHTTVPQKGSNVGSNINYSTQSSLTPTSQRRSLFLPMTATSLGVAGTGTGSTGSLTSTSFPSVATTSLTVPSMLSSTGISSSSSASSSSMISSSNSPISSPSAIPRRLINHFSGSSVLMGSSARSGTSSNVGLTNSSIQHLPLPAAASLLSPVASPLATLTPSVIDPLLFLPSSPTLTGSYHQEPIPSIQRSNSLQSTTMTGSTYSPSSSQQPVNPSPSPPPHPFVVIRTIRKPLKQKRLFLTLLHHFQSTREKRENVAKIMENAASAAPHQWYNSSVSSVSDNEQNQSLSSPLGTQLGSRMGLLQSSSIPNISSSSSCAIASTFHTQSLSSLPHFHPYTQVSSLPLPTRRINQSNAQGTNSSQATTAMVDENVHNQPDIIRQSINPEDIIRTNTGSAYYSFSSARRDNDGSLSSSSFDDHGDYERHRSTDEDLQFVGRDYSVSPSSGRRVSHLHLAATDSAPSSTPSSTSTSPHSHSHSFTSSSSFSTTTPASATPPPGLTPFPPPLRVLLADDQKQTLKIFERQIRNLGCTVIGVRDGYEALVECVGYTNAQSLINEHEAINTKNQQLSMKKPDHELLSSSSPGLSSHISQYLLESVSSLQASSSSAFSFTTSISPASSTRLPSHTHSQSFSSSSMESSASSLLTPSTANPSPGSVRSQDNSPPLIQSSATVSLSFNPASIARPIPNPTAASFSLPLPVIAHISPPAIQPPPTSSHLPCPFDLLLVDWHMPSLSGIQLSDHLQTYYQQSEERPYVCCITGSIMTTDEKREAAMAGVAEVFLKPISNQQLKDLINRVQIIQEEKKKRIKGSLSS